MNTLGTHATVVAATCARRGDRRRCDRLLRRLPPRRHGVHRRRRAGARQDHLRHHVACRRADGHVRLAVGDLDRDAQVHLRALRPPGGGDRPVDGIQPVGFIELATEPDRLEEYRRVSAFNRYCGVDVHEISAKEVADLFPLARTDDVLAGFYVKEDGRANPVDVTMALAKGARLKGATILEGVAVTGVCRRAGLSPACTPTKATSKPSTSSTAQGCGLASSVSRQVSTSPSRLPSTTT